MFAVGLVSVDLGMMVESDDSWGTRALRKRGGERRRRVQPLNMCKGVCVGGWGEKGGSNLINVKDVELLCELLQVTVGTHHRNKISEQNLGFSGNFEPNLLKTAVV